MVSAWLVLILFNAVSDGFLLDTLFGDRGMSKFILFTRQNKFSLQGDRIKSVTALRRSNFDGSKPTKFFIHGWFGSSTNWYVNQMRKAVLDEEDCNFFEVDWKTGSINPSYPDAVANTRIVGSEIADFIKALQRETSLELSKVHLIGHSLGGQVAGAVGRYFKTYKIGRITGLDPAQPGFNLTILDKTLDPSDAKFVDIIHTTQVATEPMGHVDFYPNGGITGVPVVDWLRSHLEACHMFTDSLTGNRDKCKFMAHQCNDYGTYKSGGCRSCDGNSCNRMGYFASPDGAMGNLYLTVKNHAPYCDMV